MARTIKEKEHAIKRKAILDMAQQFVYSKGYEQMTIQDILDGLQISKGAFYHYFDSKQAVLEGLVQQAQEMTQQILVSLVHDPTISAPEKLQTFFYTLNQWKIDQKPLVLIIARIWYSDDNAIIRQKLRAASSKTLVPSLTEISKQGVLEGIWTTPYPDQIGEILFSLLMSMGDAFMHLLFSEEEHHELQQAKRLVAAFTDAVERILGASPGSLSLIDPQTLGEWFI